MADKRKATIASSITIKINIGNFEHIEVTKSITTEVEFEKSDELLAKSSKLDELVSTACKNEAEKVMSDTGRKRYVKPGMADKEAPLWKDK